MFLIDQGFIALTEGGHDAASCPPPGGRILENVVAIELYRRRQTFNYYKNRRECDFIVRATEGVNLQAIQVCWTLTTGNRERELRGLLAAMDALSLPQGLIMTYDEEESLQAAPGRQIAVMPVWKWLLG